MGISNSTKKLISILAGCFYSQIGLAAGVFSTLPLMIEKEWTSHQVLPSTNLSQSSAIGSQFVLPNFQLNSFSDSKVQLDLIRGFLSKQGVHPLLNLVAKPSQVDENSRSAFGLQESSLKVKEYVLRAGQYEVCKSTIKTISAANGALHVVGVAPVVDGVYQITDDAWASRDDAFNLAINELAKQNLSTADARLTSYGKCLYPIQSELTPVWKLIVRIGAAPYQMFVGNSGVIDGAMMSFDVDGVVRAYDSGPAGGTLKDFQITLNGDGTMTNEFFTTADYNGAARMSSSTNQFTGAPSSSTFAEQSSFAHVNRHYGFVLESGYSWQGPKPLTVKTHVKFSNGNINNAQYTPFDGQAGPFILIADGDGSVLQNLPYDSDVVSHEFGHHVIFGSITTTAGESLILHEGLADAIAFMRTDDACLGESICPAASTLCQVRSQCLRTGNNTLKYNDDDYSRLGKAHLQGQLISGFFWDLKKSGSIPAADLNKLLIGMIPYLPSDANIKTMITALLDADFTLYNKQYQSVITAAADARGMGLTTLGISLGEVDGKAAGTTAAPAAKKSDPGLLGGMCAIGSSQASGSSAIWIAVVLLTPILAQLIRLKPVPVKIKRK